MLNQQKKYARRAVNKAKVQFVEVPIDDETAGEFVKSTTEHMQNLDEQVINEYLCEVCGKTERLTEKGAFDGGWDYPPFMGMWGVVSPRTCGDCGIEGTAYWHVLTQGSTDIPENHLATIKRILSERIVVTEKSDNE